MKTPDYLDQAKVALGITSDYALAARLNVTRSYMSKLRLGKNTLSDELAVQIANVIGVPAAIVLADAHVERETNPEVRAAYLMMVEAVKAGFKAGFESLLVLATGGGRLALPR